MNAATENATIAAPASTTEISEDRKVSVIRPAQPTRLPFLDGWRACAIGLVLLRQARSQIPIRLPDVVERIIDPCGVLGADLFFGLSGFLITYLLCREFTRTGTISLKRFYARRALRILPPAFVYLGLVATLRAAGAIDVTRGKFLSAIFFYANYVPARISDDFRFLLHLWSLSMEVQFYLLWPFALVLLGPRRVRTAALWLALAMPLARLAFYFLWPSQRGLMTFELHTTFDRFLWGCLLALYWNTPQIKGLIKPFRSTSAFAGLLLVFLVVNPFCERHLHGGYILCLGLTLEALLPVLLIAWVFEHRDSWMARILDSKPLRAIGLISFSLYLWQNMFLMQPVAGTWRNNLILAVAASLAAGYGSFLLTEKPFMALRKKFRV